MKNSYFIFLLILCVYFGCKKGTQTTDEEIIKNDISIITKHKPYVKLDSSAMEMIKDWKEYNITDELLRTYENTSPQGAFDNVNDLKDVTEALIDSLDIETLKTPAFKSRLNVFENEVLRLVDMYDIPAITATEVNDQIDKLLFLFGCLNAKINTVNDQETYNEEINLDDFFLLAKDSITEKKIERKNDDDDEDSDD